MSAAPDDDRDLDAALHAFGLLEGEESKAAEAREASDTAFAAAVAAWRERMAEFDETTEPGRVTDALWARIEDALAPGATSPSIRAAAPAPSRLASWWDSLGLWRGAAMASAAAAIALAVGLAAVLTGARKEGPVMVAVLLTEANRAAAVVDIFADGRAELLPLETIAVPEDRTLQVWTLWDRDRGPVSLGLLDRARQIRLPVESLPRTIPDQLFEITLEPKAGSPTGRPTGPILMKGTTSPTL